MNLRIPGPTPCPEKVLQAMAKQMINHRGKEFADLLGEVTRGLRELFQTQGDVFILTGSGTGGMEAALVNTLSPGDRVLAVSIGVFGDRFADIARAYGAEVSQLSFEWGRAADPDAVARALDSAPAVKAVLVTHNETSTGVTNDLEAISRVVRERDKLLLVDAISSLGCIDLPVDAWGCDVVVAGSQKGFMVPPGLAFVSVSERSWRAYERAQMPRFYWDFGKAKKFLEQGETPWTPAVSIIYALAVALEMIAEEGLANVFARHQSVAQRARQGAQALGLPLFAEPSHASNTVTAISAPEGLDTGRLLQLLREEHGVVLSGGQQKLKGKIFRIGHLGYVTEADIDQVMQALKAALPQAGFVRAA